ncbi:hypothetical protein DCD74_10785 [Lysobacter oculi]|uniref:Translocation and assembly module subunit TamA n=1 Tax=Solilutibacter oculi TaxID=2698682 RepID=A0A344J7U4_9GAMM|nr:autotransporter assembly complex family protein [Lysobacter oculi]AXA85104.1 hypothetical protein DCD74_10785 [Lysobacter oculi]
MTFPRLVIALSCALIPLSAQAEKISRVDIHGLDEAMAENVRVNLSLEDSLDKTITVRRLDYLLETAQDEAREALEPFGHYSPTVNVRQSGDANALVVTLDIDPGAPVRVRREDVRISNEGGDDRYMKEELAAFAPKPGEVFTHPEYEASKARITRRLAERGYFDADFTARRVEVTRAENAADIDLAWDSGLRYDMGEVSFVQAPKEIIDPGLLEKLIYWQEGEYYHQGRLDRLRKSLVSLDYFSRIDIDPRPQDAVDYLVPVTVTLTPAKRSVYNLGLSFGTDSGAGFTAGMERRYLNRRGHKALAQLDWAQKRKTLTLQYRVPAFRWLDGWYTGSLQAADEQNDYIDTRRLEFVASRSGEINRYLTAIASLHALRERWAYEVDGNGSGEPLYNYATYTYPSLRAEYIDADDRLFPRDGRGATLMLRGGVAGAGSDANFAQLHAGVRWFKGLGKRNRLLVRGEVGHTWTDSLVDIPPSLRFYAGGDRSIRGYGWREVGPRIDGSDRGRMYAIGAKNVVTGSVEFERYFTPTWGAAVFVDSGSAFNNRPDWRTGVGIGARWKSPVGPIRIDIARGLDQPDSSFQLYIGLGADL